MRYYILATDYDGTLASQGTVSSSTIKKLKQLQASGRTLILVTGRELKDLIAVFPDYAIFDYIVAENGAVIYYVATGKEELLGEAPGESFIQALREKGVSPLSVGKVITATWEPNEKAALEVIKESGCERQLIFNKGAVMILPPGINKATGLQTLLRNIHYSIHNTVAAGDAENDNSFLQIAECSVAVSNALPSLKALADWTTASPHGKGLEELINRIISNDLSDLDRQLNRHHLELGRMKDGSPFSISPYRSGILLSGVSGAGKTTFTSTVVENLVRQNYQFCIIDPEGDYLELPGAVTVGNETSIPTIEEIKSLLKDPAQNLAVCTLSIPLADRPRFFLQFMQAFLELRKEYGRPHWLLLDEAHHLIPGSSRSAFDLAPPGFNNFILTSTSPHALGKSTLSRVGMVISIGKNAKYPFEQFCRIVDVPVPSGLTDLDDDEICIWDREGELHDSVYFARYYLPSQLQLRHKKKYAQGDMQRRSFIFTGPEQKMHLVANNLMMFKHISEGIDTNTWLFHLHRKDYSQWFKDAVHDDELAKASEEAEGMDSPVESKKHILTLINKKYTI